MPFLLAGELRPVFEDSQMIEKSTAYLSSQWLYWRLRADRADRARLFNISWRRVGGLRFLKIGRLTFMLSVSREYRPL
jgi:hypothetical protein